MRGAFSLFVLFGVLSLLGCAGAPQGPPPQGEAAIVIWPFEDLRTGGRGDVVLQVLTDRVYEAAARRPGRRLVHPVR